MAFPNSTEERLRFLLSDDNTSRLLIGWDDWPVRMTLALRLKCASYGDEFVSMAPDPRPGLPPEIQGSRDLWAGCARAHVVGNGTVCLLGMVERTDEAGLIFRYDHAVIHRTGGLASKSPDVKQAKEGLIRWFKVQMLCQSVGRPKALQYDEKTFRSESAKAVSKLLTEHTKPTDLSVGGELVLSEDATRKHRKRYGMPPFGTHRSS